MPCRQPLDTAIHLAAAEQQAPVTLYGTISWQVNQRQEGSGTKPAPGTLCRPQPCLLTMRGIMLFGGQGLVVEAQPSKTNE